jgi:hypothetical protein
VQILIQGDHLEDVVEAGITGLSEKLVGPACMDESSCRRLTTNRPAPNTYRRSIAVGCDKAAPMTAAKEIKLLGDLENHLFFHTVPIKEKAALGSFPGLDVRSFRNDRIAILPKN